MGITSFEFGFFVLVVCVLYYLLPVLFWKKCILLVANLTFILSFQTQDLGYLVFVMVLSYLWGLLLEKKKHPVILATSLISMLVGLCFFKYANSFLNVPFIFQLLPDGRPCFVAPLGLSFYTFKMVGYLIDVYAQKCPSEKSLLNYAVYVSFFPQISSGPIQKARDFLSHLQYVSKWNYHVVRNGFQLIFFGLFEKMVIADRLNVLVEQCLSDLSIATPVMSLVGCIAYSFQIYADFDAYSNIANGLSGLFGFCPVDNFRAPYFSRNIKEFWGRWHISLSSWLKEYIYIPLGGNRKGTLRKYFNLLIVFLVSGMWHGATWNFILWGILNGTIQILHDVVSKFVFRGKKLLWPLMTAWIEVPLNFLIVTGLWVFFRCTTIEEIRTVFTLISQCRLEMLTDEISLIFTSETLVTLCMTLLLVFVDFLRVQGFTVTNFGKLFFPIRWAVYAGMLILMILFSLYGPGYDPSKFIYLEF